MSVPDSNGPGLVEELFLSSLLQAFEADRRERPALALAPELGLDAERNLCVCAAAETGEDPARVRPPLVGGKWI